MDTASHDRRWRALAGAIVVAVLAGCGGASSPALPTTMPVATVRSPQTPTPTPAPIPEEQLAAACEGTPVPWAAPYAGELHPLVVIDSDWLYTIVTILERHPSAEDIVVKFYAINAKWRTGAWTGPMIQLVVCDPGDTDVVRVDSCGTYTRKSDGVTGELLRTKWTAKIRVVVAKTGKTLQTKIVSGTVDKCPGSYSSAYGSLSGDPPWKLQNHEVTEEQINAYAIAVSKQPVK